MLVGETILEQLGGSKFIEIIEGTPSFGEDFLLIELKQNRANATHLEISLERPNIYTMHFYSYDKKQNIISKAVFDTVYGEILHEMYEDITGHITNI